MLTTYWFLAINILIYISANKVVKKKEEKKRKKRKKRREKSTQYSNNLTTDRSEDVNAVWIIIKGFRG